MFASRAGDSLRKDYKRYAEAKRLLCRIDYLHRLAWDIERQDPVLFPGCVAACLALGNVGEVARQQYCQHMRQQPTIPIGKLDRLLCFHSTKIEADCHVKGSGYMADEPYGRMSSVEWRSIRRSCDETQQDFYG